MPWLSKLAPGRIYETQTLITAMSGIALSYAHDVSSKFVAVNVNMHSSWATAAHLVLVEVGPLAWKLPHVICDIHQSAEALSACNNQQSDLAMLKWPFCLCQSSSRATCRRSNGMNCARSVECLAQAGQAMTLYECKVCSVITRHELQPTAESPQGYLPLSFM